MKLLTQLLRKIKPNEVYNFGYQSNLENKVLIIKFSQNKCVEELLIFLQTCEAKRRLWNSIKASSSEMFDRSVDKDGYQEETAPWN